MRKNTRIGGRLDGDIVLRDGESVVLAGVRRGSVTVGAGARLILSGTVAEDLINDGGTVEVANGGSIDGRLIHRAGETDVDPGAVVFGGVVEIDVETSVG